MIKDLNFGQAIEALKEGKKVARIGWNGKNMWLKLISFYEINEDLESVWNENVSDKSPLLPWIGMKTVDNKFIPWLASQADILSEDWCIID